MEFSSDWSRSRELTTEDGGVFGGDEHGIVILPKGNQEPLLGGVQRFIAPHCDPTVNLYDYYWVHRDGVAHSIWPIAARGCSW